MLIGRGLALDVSLLIARLGLAGIFALAACGKLSDLDGFRRTVEEFGVPARVVRPIGLLLPLAELVIAASLIPVATAPSAALAAALLLGVFCIGILRALRRGESPDCNCFGSLGSRPVGRGTLVRNGGLIAVAGFVAAAGWNDGGASAFGWIGDHGFVAAIAGVFVAVTTMHMAFSWQLFKQNGRLLDRVNDLEAGLGSHEGSADGPLEIGDLAPRFALPDLDGRTVALDELLVAPETGLLLVFTDPACGACVPLLPVLGRAQAVAGDAARVAVISTGPPDDNRIHAEQHGLEQVLLQQESEVAEAYRVFGSPGAVLVDKEGRIASRRAIGVKAVTALVEAPTSSAPELRHAPLALAEAGGR
jgi:methylamine dehydrogenase accessory protein MauD